MIPGRTGCYFEVPKVVDAAVETYAEARGMSKRLVLEQAVALGLHVLTLRDKIERQLAQQGN